MYLQTSIRVPFFYNPLSQHHDLMGDRLIHIILTAIHADLCRDFFTTRVHPSRSKVIVVIPDVFLHSYK